MAGAVLGAVAGFAVVVVLVKVVPPWVASTDGLKGKARAEEIGRARTAFLAILAGTLATVGAVFTGLSYRLNRQGHDLDRAGQITERFTRAIDQLGSSELDVRLGGIYALERIARDSPNDHPQVIEVLTAYVREHAPWPPAQPRSGPQGLDVRATAIEAIERIAQGLAPAHHEDQTAPAIDAATEDNAETAGTPLPKPPTDVQATLTVIGRRIRTQDPPDFHLDLHETDLRGVSLGGEEVHLEGANLRGAHLQKAYLHEAHLEGAILIRAHLEGADLRGAHLQKADLGGAHLEEADLREAHLEGAILMARLKGANLGEAHLQKADLRGAHLQKAYLRGAHLQKAYLYGAHLEEANLRGAHLQKADLGGAHLLKADLGGAHLEEANLGEAHLERANLHGAHLEGVAPSSARNPTLSVCRH